MVTGEEPEIAEKIAQLTIAATAKPPGNPLVAAVAIPINRLAIAPRVMMLPASKNIGIASKIPLSKLIQRSSAK